MEDLDISALLSCTLALLGLGDDPLSALKTRAALENTNKYELHSLLWNERYKRFLTFRLWFWMDDLGLVLK